MSFGSLLRLKKVHLRCFFMNLDCFSWKIIMREQIRTTKLNEVLGETKTHGQTDRHKLKLEHKETD